MENLAPVQVEDLKRYFARREDVAFAFLFGSHARGTATRISDLDIAVYFIPLSGDFDYEAETEYPAEESTWEDLERLTGREVEMLVLNRASPNISASALGGVALSIKSWSLYVDFMLHATAEAEEFRADMLEDFLGERHD